jgi:polyphenol oxidase
LAWIRFGLGAAEILFSDRTGGVSDPPFDTANAGYGRGDDPARVAENRRRIGAALGGRAADPDRWTCLHQVHGAAVHLSAGLPSRSGGLTPAPDAGRSPEQPMGPPDADACVTTDPDSVLAILTADCGPVALAAPGVAAAVHAGWRGVAAGVLEAAGAEVRRRAGGPVQALIGPCIHPCCYEFSPSDLGPIVARLGAAVEGRTTDGRPALDLPAAIAIALAGAGVDEIDDVGICTACSPRHFSHRRDGRTGLQAMLVAGPG